MKNETDGTVRRLALEGRKLARVLLADYPHVPCDGFLRALCDCEALLGAVKPLEVNPVQTSKGRRMFREDMVSGGRYNLYWMGKPHLVEYLGEVVDSPGEKASRFRLLFVDKGREDVWFFGDAGLTPYFNSDGTVKWNADNWVGSLEMDERWIEMAVKKMNEELVDDDVLDGQD
jgi:hypothetical protein